MGTVLFNLNQTMFLFNTSRLRHQILPIINKQIKLVTDFAFILSSALSCFFYRKTFHALVPVERVLVTLGNYIQWRPSRLLVFLIYTCFARILDTLA